MALQMQKKSRFYRTLVLDLSVDICLTDVNEMGAVVQVLGLHLTQHQREE